MLIKSNSFYLMVPGQKKEIDCPGSVGDSFMLVAQSNSKLKGQIYKIPQIGRAECSLRPIPVWSINRGHLAIFSILWHEKHRFCCKYR
jgi:hypothetical protein